MTFAPSDKRNAGTVVLAMRPCPSCGQTVYAVPTSSRTTAWRHTGEPCEVMLAAVLPRTYIPRTTTGPRGPLARHHDVAGASGGRDWHGYDTASEYASSRPRRERHAPSGMEMERFL